MKSDKLQNALGKVDPALIARADEPKKANRLKYIKIIAPIAAVLAIAICFGVFAGIGMFGERTLPHMKYNLFHAKYPLMAKYPGEEHYDSQKYKDWLNSINKQRQYLGAGENLDEFFCSTITEFLSGQGEKNVVYSPLNVYFALAMIAEITNGESRAQILDLLDADSIESLRTQAHAIWNANYSDEGTVTSILASSIWLDENGSYKNEALKNLVNYYYASSFKGDIGSEEMNSALRSWINEQTGGMLEDAIENVELTPETIMALATTIYFNARWINEFSKSRTESDIFHSPSGDVETDFMKSSSVMSYYWGEKFGATQKHLVNSGSMFFILPDEGVSVDELISNGEFLSFISNISSPDDYKNQAGTLVHFSVPKFDVNSETDLKEGLINLGVTDCFDPVTADFSPLTDAKTCITTAKHSARVMIDEEGVTAAAFTLSFVGSSAPMDEIDFTLDRPFIFVITGSDGLPLFVGIVNQP